MDWFELDARAGPRGSPAADLRFFHLILMLTGSPSTCAPRRTNVSAGPEIVVTGVPTSSQPLPHAKHAFGANGHLLLASLSAVRFGRFPEAAERTWVTSTHEHGPDLRQELLARKGLLDDGRVRRIPRPHGMAHDVQHLEVLAPRAQLPRQGGATHVR